MKPGPPPMPRNLRLVRGSRDHHGPNPNGPKNPITEPPVKIPLPPEYLTAPEIDVFVTMARKLAGMRVMTEADVDLLVVYVRNWIDAKEAHQKVLELGMVVKSPKNFPMLNPYLSVRRKAESVCIRVMTEFGLTPSSRNRVSE